jgi:hypothetical protein
LSEQVGVILSQLRDFFYLDTSRVHSFVSQIHGGLVSEISETIRKKGVVSGGINIPFSAKLDASKGQESEQQQTLQLTDGAYFSVLYEYLVGEKEVADLGKTDVKKLKVGQFVETNGRANPPIIDAWLKRINSLIDFIDRNSKTMMRSMSPQQRRNRQSQLSSRDISMFKDMFTLLEDYISLSQTDSGKLYIELPSGTESGAIWCGLIPEYCVVPLHSAFPSEVSMVGKVERILAEGETWQAVDFSQLNQSQTNIDSLFSGINAIAGMMNSRQVSQDDFVVEHPAIFVTPIAIYR